MVNQAETDGGGLKSELLEKEKEVIRLQAKLEEAAASNKRLSTQNSKLRKNGGESDSTVVEVGEPKKAVVESVQLLNTPEKPKEEHEHEVFSFMKDCPNCHKPNPTYKPAKYFCKGCNAPLQGELSEITECWNGSCGGIKDAEGNIVVKDHPAKALVF